MHMHKPLGKVDEVQNEAEPDDQFQMDMWNSFNNLLSFAYLSYHLPLPLTYTLISIS